MRTRFAYRGTSRLAYDPGDPRPAGHDSHTVLVLHDLLADRSSLGALRDALAAHYRVIAPDARGHGASASLANRWYTVGELAADARAILDAEGVTACHVIGHGLGGATAFELARRDPSRIRSLTLIAPALLSVLDTHPDPSIRAARQQQRELDRAAGDLAYKGLLDKALDAYLAPRWGEDWHARIPRTRRSALHRHAGALAALLPALDAYSLDPASMAGMHTPTLIIASEDDTLLSQAAARLATFLPSAILVQVPGPSSAQPGHDIALASASDAITRFIASHGG